MSLASHKNTYRQLSKCYASQTHEVARLLGLVTTLSMWVLKSGPLACLFRELTIAPMGTHSCGGHSLLVPRSKESITSLRHEGDMSLSALNVKWSLFAEGMVLNLYYTRCLNLCK